MMRAWIPLIVAGLGLAAVAFGQTVVPVGNQFQVNTYSTDIQNQPAVSVGPVGGFVVVWTSGGSNGSDTSNYSVQGQRFAADGTFLGGEFQVNTYTTNTQGGPSVSVGPAGDFVVVWTSDGSNGTDTSYYSVWGQRFASDGSLQGGEFQVNTYTTNRQGEASVSVGPTGDFVVVWTSDGSSGTDTWFESIHGQRFASDGSFLGGEFQVNTYTTSSQFYHSVSVGPAGDFVVVWDSEGSGGSDISDGSVQAQVFFSDGSRSFRSDFQVNTYTTDRQRHPSVSVGPTGDFVVVWNSYGSNGTDTSSYSVQGQRFASNGSALGGEFQVNSYTTSRQNRPSVSVGPTGDVVVVWTSGGSNGTDTSYHSIQGQLFASDGSTLGGEFQVNSYTTSSQYRASVSVGPGGNFVVVWVSDGSSGKDTSYSSVQGQRFAIALFADGFESGDTSAWTVTVGGP